MLTASSDFWELALVLIGKDPEDADDYDTPAEDVDDELIAKFGLDGEAFEAISRELIKYADHWRSPFTDREYRGFTKGNWALVKMRIES